jgi:uncharacterized protein YukJ
VLDARREDDLDTPHYQIHVEAAAASYRIAVNVLSQLPPSELLFVVDEHFQHPVTDKLEDLAEGFTQLPKQPGTASLDYIRGNLLDRTAMRALPSTLPGSDNDLSDRVAHYVERARTEADAVVYAFGERWGPEHGERDKIFGFEPGNGIHDIHMNQGNHPRFEDQDGVWQDGALIFRFPATGQWVALFLAFQSQAWHTDDATGHAIAEPGPEPGAGDPDFRVRIIGALVNPIGPAPEAETVTLLNTTPEDIDLTGWGLIDKAERQQPLDGAIAAGATRVIRIAAPLALGNKGGAVTLVDAAGLKVDGVAYTKAQAGKEGWTVVF